MLTKRKLPRGKVRVTFQMPALEGVTQLNLVGDFNNWSMLETPLAQAADGSWSVALTLEAGRRYQYRYFANGATWHNDWAADAYVPNTFGSDNCVVNLEEEAAPKPAPKKKAAAKSTTGRKKTAKA
jgi:1,4-alpha-glucan branching enzyme